MRVNINMDEELVKKVDEVAEKMFVSRSAYISFAVSQKLKSDEAMDNLPNFIQVIKEAIQLDKSKNNDSKK